MASSPEQQYGGKMRMTVRRRGFLALMAFASLFAGLAAEAGCTSSTVEVPPVAANDGGLNVDAARSSQDAATTTIGGEDASRAEAGTMVDGGADVSVPFDGAADAADSAAPLKRYDVNKDWSTTANPNTPWTYGYTRTLGAADAGDAGALVTFSTFSGGTWNDPSNISLGAPSVWRNETASTQYGVAPGELSAHPGSLGEYTVIRWTAPASGMAIVHVAFGAGDIGDTDGYVLHNGVTLFHDAQTGSNPVHDTTVAVVAGDHLDVAVGPNGSFTYDNTPVVVLIDAP